MICNQEDCLHGRMIIGSGETNGVLYLGEAPGKTEELLGKIFTGQAGQYLVDKVKGTKAYFTNAVKCNPGRRPKRKEIDHCWDRWLDKEISSIKPNKIVCLGKTAGVSLGIMGINDSVQDYIGNKYSYQGIPVQITYHPAYAKRFAKPLDL